LIAPYLLLSLSLSLSVSVCCLHFCFVDCDRLKHILLAAEAHAVHTHTHSLTCLTAGLAMAKPVSQCHTLLGFAVARDNEKQTELNWT